MAHLIVYTNAAEGRDAEYNSWYTNTHLDEVLQVPGIVAAQRFAVSDVKMEPPSTPSHRYLAIYEIEGPPSDVVDALLAASATMNISSALADDARVTLYEPISERVSERLPSAT
jgi:hypothetical protein